MTSKLLGYNNISDSKLLAVSSKYVYIPLIINSDKNITILIKKGDYVFKGMKIGKTKGKYITYIYSSISGIVVDFVEKSIFDNQKVKCIKIENDYKERPFVNQEKCNNISKISKEDFLIMLNNITYIENKIPIICKYESCPKILIINTLGYKRYIYNNYFILNYYINEILETVDAILEINKISNCYIIIDKKNKKIKKLLDQFIGTYLKIKVLEINKFPKKDFEEKIIKRVKSFNYRKNLQKKDFLFHDLATIYKLYIGLKYNKLLLNKFITVITNNFKIEIKCIKIGTLLSDLVLENNNEIYLISKNKVKKITNPANYIINDDIDGIINKSY